MKRRVHEVRWVYTGDVFGCPPASGYQACSRACSGWRRKFDHFWVLKFLQKAAENGRSIGGFTGRCEGLQLQLTQRWEPLCLALSKEMLRIRSGEQPQDIRGSADSRLQIQREGFWARLRQLWKLLPLELRQRMEERRNGHPAETTYIFTIADGTGNDIRATAREKRKQRKREEEEAWAAINGTFTTRSSTSTKTKLNTTTHRRE